MDGFSCFPKSLILLFEVLILAKLQGRRTTIDEKIVEGCKITRVMQPRIKMMTNQMSSNFGVFDRVICMKIHQIEGITQKATVFGKIGP